MRRVIAAFAALVATFVPGAAQDWPNRPITMVIPLAAGGGSDGLIRVFTPRLGELLGQQVIVENAGGAGGMIGAARVAKAPPDGYQVLLGTFRPEDAAGDALAAYTDRIERYMLKAAREAKLRTSWISPDADYEPARAGFVRAILAPGAANAFVADLHAQVEPVAWFGALNSLAHLLPLQAGDRCDLLPCASRAGLHVFPALALEDLSQHAREEDDLNRIVGEAQRWHSAHRARQCENSTGSSSADSRSRVAPPSTHSRMRVCP